MYKIVIKGEAGETNAKDKSMLDGIDCQDNFSEYFHSSFTHGNRTDIGEQPLIDKGVEGGQMSFSYSNKDKKLYVSVVYSSKQELNQEELDLLIDYTQGQMSDGIGEGFEQYPCIYDEDEEEIFLSPWFYGQKLTATQKEI